MNQEIGDEENLQMVGRLYLELKQSEAAVTVLKEQILLTSSELESIGDSLHLLARHRGPGEGMADLQERLRKLLTPEQICGLVGQLRRESENVRVIQQALAKF